MGNTAVENFNLKRPTDLYHLQQALIAGGYEVMSIKIVRDPDTDEENVVVKFFDGHEKRANIHADSIGSALYDVMKQIEELRR